MTPTFRRVQERCDCRGYCHLLPRAERTFISEYVTVSRPLELHEVAALQEVIWADLRRVR